MLTIPATGLKGVTNRQRERDRERQRETETEGERYTKRETDWGGGRERRGRREERGLE